MWQNLLRNAGAALVAGIACSGAAAQPANDLCANAPLIGLGAVEGITVGAAANGTSTCGGSNASPDVYYRFTAPASCQFEVMTCDGNTDYDTVVSIHSACPATSSNQIVCSNDGCGSPRSRAVFTGTRGTTYTIRVAGAFGDSGAFTLIIRQLGRPANDTCAAATTIFGPSGTLSADTSCAMSEGFQSCGEGTSTGSPNLYYRWTAPANGVATFDTCLGASFRTYISASTDCPHTNLNLVGCNHVSCGTLSTMQFGVVGGATYLIRVGGRGDERGTFTLAWSFSPGLPPHDICDNAQRVSLGTIHGSTAGATVSTFISCFPSATNDVFYRFNSPVESIVTINTCSPETNFDTVLSVHSSCPASDANRIVCNDDACALSSSLTFPASPGVDYLIRVAAYHPNVVGTFALNITAEVDAIVFDPSTLGEYYLLGDNRSITDFRQLAASLGAELTTFHSFSEAQFVTKSVMGAGNVARSVAIGMSDAATEGTMRWFNNDTVDFRFFLAGQPDDFNGGEDYVHILDPVSGVWNDYPGTPFPGLFGAAESNRDLVWWDENPANGHFYLLFKPTSWQGAQARARAMGGNLVTINDAAENEYVRATFASAVGGNDIWLGMSDFVQEGIMTWADGTTPTYSNFPVGQPDNIGGSEDYVELNPSTGLWNDIPNLRVGNPNQGVAEIVLPQVIGVAHGPGGCGTYALLSPSSFYPAGFAGYRLIGHPVTIGNAAENEFIRATFAATGGGRRIWLDATDMDDEGHFVWLDREPFNYSNFAPGQPDNAGNQDYVVMNPDGTWSDVSSIEPGTFHGVIELYCPCDWDANGIYNSQDLFDYLAAFFTDQGDINCDGTTNSQDFFDFLSCFLSGCD